MNSNSKIYVAGHMGLVGSAITRNLVSKGFTRIITRTHAELDLCDQSAVKQFFEDEKPEYVFLAAAKVGGILANNTYPGDFIHQNLLIQSNVIESARQAQVRRLLFLGSSCIFPRECPQPIKEEYLLTGSLEPTNRPYAIAKIAGIEMCWSYNRQYGTRYLAAMPTNLYGPGDNYDLQNSHVLPALIRKVHLAKLMQSGDLHGVGIDQERHGLIPTDVLAALGISEDLSRIESNGPSVVVWGTGMVRREFLHSHDMAEACVMLMNLTDRQYLDLVDAGRLPLINIGSGRDHTIAELFDIVKKMLRYDGKVVWDKDKPDGTPQKLLDTSKIEALGWKPGIDLPEGVEAVYEEFSRNRS